MKKNIHFMLSAAIYAVAVFMAPGCRKSADVKLKGIKTEKELSDKGEVYPYPRIPTIHLYKDTIYTLSNFFTRQNGEQLIIDEGTVIKVKPGSANTITISAGGILIANGSQQFPIVFTSADLTGTQNNNWGGLVIQGKSINNSTRPSGDVTDGSGSLTYARIEFAGLTLNAVGSGTRLENIQVSYASIQPSFEIDGGTFNARNLVSYAAGASADFYITQGYTGKMQQILAYRHPFFGKPIGSPGNALTGLFIENNPDNPSLQPYTNPVISNMTVLGPDNQKGSSVYYSDLYLRTGAMITTGNARFHIRNSLLLGFPRAGWIVDDFQTADHERYGKPSEFTHSIVQCNDSARTFYLEPGAYPPYNSADFLEFITHHFWVNKRFLQTSDFGFTSPFDYEAPNLLPRDTAVVTGTDFSGPDYTNAFFLPVNFRGAIGSDNWLSGWTNFTPLHTNYNFGQ